MDGLQTEYNIIRTELLKCTANEGVSPFVQKFSKLVFFKQNYVILYVGWAIVDQGAENTLLNPIKVWGGYLDLPNKVIKFIASRGKVYKSLD